MSMDITENYQYSACIKSIRGIIVNKYFLIRTLSNLQYEKDFVLYISTSPRIGPFVLGFIAAYFIYKLKQQKIVLSKVKLF